MDKRFEDRSNKLAMAHWEYIAKVLLAHDTDADQIDVAEFHYIEAFKHGYKHAYEDLLGGA